MKQRLHVLVAHESYLLRGGEDRVVESEVALLRDQGHRVTLLSRHNAELGGMHPLKLLQQTFWSRRTTEAFTQLHRDHPIDVVHVHNTLPLISPSIYWAAARHRVPVVQTLHNFRLLCPQAMFLRDGKFCEDCLGKVPWRGAIRRCYRGSVSDSTVMASMLTFHRGIGTWDRRIQRYIALNHFSRDKFVQGGLPPDRVVVKPNFVADRGEPDPDIARAGFLYVGRLSPEKGTRTLAEAFASLSPDVALRVAGAGPDEALLGTVCPSAVALGELDAVQVHREMLRASALVVPSISYGDITLVALEAFAAGLPVIASRTGALAEAVEDGVSGLLFDPGNPADLAQRVRWALAHPREMRRMGEAARQRFVQIYSAAPNYQRLLEIYGMAASACAAPQA